jgi:dihydrofolate reductase
MRKIVVAMSVSLDGFVAGPNGELDWHLVDEELHAYFNEQLSAMSAFLHGRVMYELMAGYWPTADRDPSSSPAVVEFARIWRDMPKIVYSRTLEHVDWNATIARDVVPGEVRSLKAEPGGDLALGGAEVAASFQRLGLVDEYWLYVHPVAIGQGRPMFERSQPRLPLDFVGTRAFGNGVVLNRYRRPGSQ